MTETTRVTEKGPATIPKAIREKYEFEPGDEVVWLDTDGGIVVRKASRRSASGTLVPEETPFGDTRSDSRVLERRVRTHRQSIESDLQDE